MTCTSERDLGSSMTNNSGRVNIGAETSAGGGMLRLTLQRLTALVSLTETLVPCAIGEIFNLRNVSSVTQVTLLPVSIIPVTSNGGGIGLPATTSSSMA